MFSRLKQLFKFGKSAPNNVPVARRDASASAGAESATAAAMHALFIEAVLDRDIVETALKVPEKLVGQAVEQQLRNPIQRAAAVPRLPTVIPQLLKQLRDPNASARDYVAIITQDPVVATAVLRVANSVYFNPYRKALDNFERAVAALGIVKLRMVLSTAALQPVLLNRGDNLPQQIWDHSLACAICCQYLAEREGVDAFKAYLTGLVHDIGVVTIYNQTQSLSREFLHGQAPSGTLLTQLFAQWAQLLAFWIAQDWKLPEEVVRALAEQSEAKQKTTLGQILLRSNRLCEAYHVFRAGKIERETVERLVIELQFPGKILEILDSGFGEADARKLAINCKLTN
ncbi:MAG: Fis family transcriptional regulator [Verrucomicrobiaceae bacterium]|nr:Fis family transcriptional regulator [Verrucomicrobiaceae bacterium]